jgi:hypothetical protein
VLAKNGESLTIEIRIRLIEKKGPCGRKHIFPNVIYNLEGLNINKRNLFISRFSKILHNKPKIKGFLPLALPCGKNCIFLSNKMVMNDF